VRGWADPTQAAWQLTSPALQPATQLAAGEMPVWMLTGALVMEASLGMAKTPATRVRMTVEYFMLNDDVRLEWRDRYRNKGSKVVLNRRQKKKKGLCKSSQCAAC
jgi:hypothetical protein